MWYISGACRCLRISAGHGPTRRSWCLSTSQVHVSGCVCTCVRSVHSFPDLDRRGGDTLKNTETSKEEGTTGLGYHSQLSKAGPLPHVPSHIPQPPPTLHPFPEMPFPLADRPGACSQGFCENEIGGEEYHLRIRPVRPSPPLFYF